jgi:hypothetical protein
VRAGTGRFVVDIPKEKPEISCDPQPVSSGGFQKVVCQHGSHSDVLNQNL